MVEYIAFAIAPSTSTCSFGKKTLQRICAVQKVVEKMRFN